MREDGLKRLKLAVRGAVQGVGFRPFVFRLATELKLNGWVRNSPEGVFIEIEGPPASLEHFLLRLQAERPPSSFIQSLEPTWLEAAGHAAFEIKPSDASGSKTALVLPDIATCPNCLREIFDPANRRWFYPFTNCTHCGPRFSIIKSLPYDRANTSMERFVMCLECQREYDDPRDRRFHAQPNACAACGPQLALWDRDGRPHGGETCCSGAAAAHSAQGALFANRQALEGAAEALRSGRIIAVKGLGGFHLMAAAHDEKAVKRLRESKHREEKPFALMFPSLEAVQSVCRVNALEARLLRSPEAPIVLLERSRTAGPELPDALAPGNPCLGVMLPYTPLHHLLLSLFNFPVIATSGNLSDEPICTDESEALARLGEIAQLFLVHNRPIVRHVDDSIVRIAAGREMVLRRARGYAPLPIQLRAPEEGRARETEKSDAASGAVLAAGAHLKSAVGLCIGQSAFISQHIGDLETPQAHDAFRRVIADFEKLYETAPFIIAADAHPDYLSTQFARRLASPMASQELRTRTAETSVQVPPVQLVTVQHHLAHVLSCMAENDLQPPFLGVSWDGAGYGLDGTIWGGEFFAVREGSWTRTACFRRFRLPGGEKAIREPRRAALGLLHEMLGESAFDLEIAALRAFSRADRSSLRTMLARGLNSPLTSSAGRLFDAVASIIGLRQQTRFEGQAAMDLEFALAPDSAAAYPMTVAPSASSRPDPSSAPPAHGLPADFLDWEPMIRAVLADLEAKVSPGEIAARFHNGMIEGMVSVAHRAGLERVVLSGGCFQNKYLLERAVQRLKAEGFRPAWHQRVPPNDGGISLGQIAAVRIGILF